MFEWVRIDEVRLGFVEPNIRTNVGEVIFEQILSNKRRSNNAVRTNGVAPLQVHLVDVDPRRERVVDVVCLLPFSGDLCRAQAGPGQHRDDDDQNSAGKYGHQVSHEHGEILN